MVISDLHLKLTGKQPNVLLTA